VGGANERTITAGSVVVASGMQRTPRLPAVAAAVPDGIRSIHAAAYRSPDALPPGGVLVVGGAQSGCQIAEDLLDAGRDVWLAASGAPRVPRRYRGRDIFEWLLETGFFDQSLADLPEPAMRWWPQPNVSGIGEGGHTLSLQAVAARGAVLTGRVASVAGGTVDFAADLGASIAMGDRTSVVQRQRIDAWIEATGRTAPPLEPDAADQPVDDPAAWSGPDRLDLVRAGVGCVIWATGFGADLDWVDRSLLGERGLPVHSDGAAPVPGLWFLGVPWMRHRRSSIILGADEDGAFVAEQVAARLARRRR
jgi:putative flavoprotein involved in K+ transport